jgi:putative transposase
VDLGVKTLAVFSDGRSPVNNPKHYDTARRKLARLSRAVSRKQGPDRRTGGQPSNRWRKANAARTRLHHRTVNLRADAIHKLTTALAREYGTVVVEDLNVAGMVKNRRLARAISDAGSVRSAGSSPTRRHGTAGRSPSRTAGSRPRRHAPDAAR